MQRDEIGARQKLVQLHLGHTDLGGALLGQEGVIGHHLHLEAERAGADDGTDIARTDHAQRLAGQFHTHETRLFPFARMGGGIGLGDLAGHREHHRDGMLGGRDRIAEGRVHHDDALFRRLGDVDIVDTNARAADHLKVGGSGDDLFRDLAGRADGKSVILTDDGEQLVLILADGGVEGDIDPAIFENLNGGVRQAVGNENFGGHGFGPLFWKRSVRRAEARPTAKCWDRW